MTLGKLSFLAACLTLANWGSAQDRKEAPVVLFVCEHGAAKSVVAAAHFNRMAADRGLAARAIARGTEPDAELAAAAVKGLAQDGLTASGKPQRVTAGEAAAARRVVALGCDLSKVAPALDVERWDDVPPMSQDYAAARKVIVERVRRLMAELEGGR